MKTKKEVKVAILISVILIGIFLISSSNALVYRGNPFMNLSASGFGPEHTLEGTVNFSLINEKTNTEVLGKVWNDERRMGLLEFLQAANAQFTCDPENCFTRYTTSGSGSLTKTLTLTKGQEAFVGIRIQGSNVQIMDFSFIMDGTSSTTHSCSDSIVKLDILNDNSIDWEHRGTEVLNCSDYMNACFSGLDVINFNLDNTPKCQKIRVNKTGKVDLGGYLEGTGGDIVLSLYDPLTSTNYECEISGVAGLNECQIDATLNPGFFINSTRDVYVCVKDPTVGQFIIKAESYDPCGFYGSPQSFDGNYTFDYPIYLKYYGFSTLNEPILFDESSFFGTGDLIEYLDNYIGSHYSRNCNPCIIPLKFKVKEDQTIMLSELNLLYSQLGGISPENNFWDITPNYARVNMDRSILQLNALDFKAPKDKGTYTFTFRIGGAVASQQFKVEEGPTIQSIWPTAIVPNEETTFYVAATPTPGKTITSYVWNWGDGSSEQTTMTNNATHSYNLGIFDLIVKVNDNSGLQGSSTVKVTSNLTKELVSSEINEVISKVNAIYSQYNSVESWYRDLLDLNLTEINTTLRLFSSQVQTATTSQLATMKQRIDSFNIPNNITDSSRLYESFYYPNPDNINPAKISELEDSRYETDQREEYQNKIAVWQEENLELKLSGFVKSMFFDNRKEDKATILNIKLNPLTSLDYTYVIINLPSGVSYNQVKIKNNTNFETTNLGDSIGISFFELTNIDTISVAFPGEQDLASIFFFASPSLGELRERAITPSSGRSSPTIWIIIIIIAVIVGLFFIWRKKDSSGGKNPFANPEELLRIQNYIHINTEQGKQKKDIESELSNMGLTKKQIYYAFKTMDKEQPNILLPDHLRY
ncbi:MAG: PKD domain-containing protein [archaeon]|nr:MAG: PKD domain-containing protein [archaeon]